MITISALGVMMLTLRWLISASRLGGCTGFQSWYTQPVVGVRMVGVLRVQEIFGSEAVSGGRKSPSLSLDIILT
jgi:ABC-type transport system involved in cytochrome bd biosynthesis fused ATPase/permease subunit